MDLDEYQAQADKTDSVPLGRGTDEKLHFLVHGIVDEVGQFASLLKKCMRHDIKLADQRAELKTKLGDMLWYLAAMATHFDTHLSEIAKQNLAYLHDRWTDQSINLFQREVLSIKPEERFPPKLEFTFRRVEEGGLVKMQLLLPNGDQVGDTVDDNEYSEDFYRFHDVIHIGLMARFRWSPVFRKLLGIKRKSDKTTDRVEDGAKARDIEEAMSRLIYLYFEGNRFLDGATSIDTSFLKQLRLFSGQREIGWVSQRQWQDFMLHTAGVVREMIAAAKQGKGGMLIADMDAGTIQFKPIA